MKAPTIYILLLMAVYMLSSCTKNTPEPQDQKDPQEQKEEEVMGVKLGYAFTKGQWHRMGNYTITGNMYPANDNLYVYSIEGTIQRRSYLYRYSTSTKGWKKLYEQLNPEAEKIAIDPIGNVYMAVTHLRTEGSGFGMKYFYTYKVQWLTANDQWESLGEIPNPTQADFTMMELFHVAGKLHFIGLRQNKQLQLYSLVNGSWTETASIDNVRHRLYGLTHHLRANGDLTLAIEKVDQPNVIVSYTFNGSQLLKANEDTFLSDVYLTVLLGEDGLYNGAKEGNTTDAILIRSHDQKEIFKLPGYTLYGDQHPRTVSGTFSHKKMVYAQVQTYVIPEWLNAVLAVYDTSTGKIKWLPNISLIDNRARVKIADIIHWQNRHYCALPDGIYYFEEE